MKNVQLRMSLSFMSAALITVSILMLLPACANKSIGGNGPSTSQGSSY